MVITMKEINKGKLGIVMEVSSYEIIIKLRYKEVKRSWQHIPEREREREVGVWGEMFQAEGIVSENTLRWKRAWLVKKLKEEGVGAE